MHFGCGYTGAASLQWEQILYKVLCLKNGSIQPLPASNEIKKTDMSFTPIGCAVIDKY